eukprot:TRINITY_DN1966_c0_g1_i1.p1 TRINITY_DN1966_c0_g1~~TRINITY_DN1966_c0_g1_i1.p1  ORF type:complete len:1430 (+),score=352.18 TRINITY_DN1966_c0_g1_i1:59-4348(+)
MAAEESDAERSAPSASEPENWNSDDEPPEEKIGDETVCSRDGFVRKVVLGLGQGLEQPGQRDLVRVRYRVLGADASSPGEDAVLEEVELEATMGKDQLPVGVELALRCMRPGERALVVGPPAYAARASPLTGRKLRSRGRGRLPPMSGPASVPRKRRFLPATPQEIAKKAAQEVKLKQAAQAKADVKPEAQADASASGEPKLEGASLPASTAAAAATTGEPKLEGAPLPASAAAAAATAGDAAAEAAAPAADFRAEVELLQLRPVVVLTEDGLVLKQVLREGDRWRRMPRMGDLVTFWAVPESAGGAAAADAALAEAERCTVVLGKSPEAAKYAELLRAGLQHVLLSMRQGERCLARLCAADEAPERRFRVEMGSWQRRDSVKVHVPGHSEGELTISRYELCSGRTRLLHSIDDGSNVLVGMLLSSPASGDSPLAGADGDEKIVLLSWRLGEGSVPRYVEAAVQSLRLAESAAFEVSSEVALAAPTGPDFEGRTPLRRLRRPALQPLLHKLLLRSPPGTITADSGAQEKTEGASSGSGAGAETEAPAASGPAVAVAEGWAEEGDTVDWADLLPTSPSDSDKPTLRLALLAAREAEEVDGLSDRERQTHLFRERERGNALAKLGRFPEARVAYARALDFARRTAMYEATFPREHGRVAGASSQDPAADALEDKEERSRRRHELLALHLNLALCAAKAGDYADARRHASAVLVAEPAHAKALLRRGTAAMELGDHAAAAADLQHAAELQPQELLDFLLISVESDDDTLLLPCGNIPLVAGFHEKVKSAHESLRNTVPILVAEGTSGTYLITEEEGEEGNAPRNLLILKPKDEEVNAPHNPRGRVCAANTPALKVGVYSTQQAVREVAAYLLDHHSHAGVPRTTLVHVKHPGLVKSEGVSVLKIAALQDYISSSGTSAEFGPSRFSKRSVHAVGIIDVRILNGDRHCDNMLAIEQLRTEVCTVCPIDHGHSLPDRLEIYSEDIVWMSFPQAQEHFDEPDRVYISQLLPQADDRILGEILNISRPCRRLCESSTMALQLFTKHNLTLFDVGTFLYRPSRETKERSDFEHCITAAIVEAFSWWYYDTGSCAVSFDDTPSEWTEIQERTYAQALQAKIEKYIKDNAEPIDASDAFAPTEGMPAEQLDLADGPVHSASLVDERGGSADVVPGAGGGACGGGADGGASGDGGEGVPAVGRLCHKLLSQAASSDAKLVLMEEKLKEALDHDVFEQAVVQTEPGIYTFGSKGQVVVELTPDGEAIAARKGEPFQPIGDFVRYVASEGTSSASEQAAPPAEVPPASEEVPTGHSAPGGSAERLLQQHAQTQLAQQQVQQSQQTHVQPPGGRKVVGAGTAGQRMTSPRQPNSGSPGQQPSSSSSSRPPPGAAARAGGPYGQQGHESSVAASALNPGQAAGVAPVGGVLSSERAANDGEPFV